MQVCKDALERARPRTDQKREAPAEMDKVVTFESDHVTTYSVKMGSQRFSMAVKHDDQGLCSSVVIGSAVLVMPAKALPGEVGGGGVQL